MAERITPFDPYGFGRYLHSVTDDSNGQRTSEGKSCYEAIAKNLQGAGRFCYSERAPVQLIANLRHHHADVARRIVGSIAVEEHHLTEDQLLARAREFYCSVLKAQDS